MEMLVSAGFDRTINFWDLQTGACVRTWQMGQSICAIAFNPAGDILASGSIERTIGLWDVATGKCLQTLIGHTDWILHVAVSPFNELVSASKDNTLKIWS